MARTMNADDIAAAGGATQAQLDAGVAAASFKPGSEAAAQIAGILARLDVLDSGGIPTPAPTPTPTPTPTALMAVATGGDIFDTNGNNMTAANSRSLHTATDDLTVVQFVFPAFYTAIGTETAISGANTFKVGVEKGDGSANLGTVTGGSYTSDGNWFVTGPLTLSQPIARGSKFFVRSRITGTNFAYIGPSSARKANTAAGERMDFAFSGAASTDRSGLTGTFTDGNAGSVIRPFAIIAQTSRKAVLIVGDSIAIGQADTITADNHLGYIARALGEALVAYSKVSIPGERMNQFGPKRASGKTWFSDVINEYGVNDIDGGGVTTLAGMQGRYATLWAYFSDKRVFQTTMTPESTGTYTSDAGQTPKTAWQDGGVWSQTNAWLRTNPAPVVVVFDAAAVSMSPTKFGVWRSDGGIARANDGVHPNNVGVTELKPSVTVSYFT